MPDTSESQKSMSDTLELKLHVVVTHSVGAKNQIQVLCKTNKCSNPLSYLLPAPKLCLNILAHEVFS